MKIANASTGVLFLLAALLGLVGCVERKLLIRSDPPGARIDLNREGFLPGATPLEVPFTRYGTYHVRAVHPDSEEFEGTAEVVAPWWAVTPFDLFTDVLLPFEFSDQHELTLKLRPARPPATADELRQRHEELKGRAEKARREALEATGSTGSTDRP